MLIRLLVIEYNGSCVSRACFDVYREYISTSPIKIVDYFFLLYLYHTQNTKWRQNTKKFFRSLRFWVAVLRCVVDVFAVCYLLSVKLMVGTTLQLIWGTLNSAD